MFKDNQSIDTDQTPAFGFYENVMLCLTTLHHRRYVEDMIHTIGLPIGSHVRLRYRKTYACSQIWDVVYSKKLKPDQVVLIALAGTDISGATDVAPIRKGKIFKARCEGDLLILDIALDDFVFESSSNGEFWSNLSSSSPTLPKGFTLGQSSAGTYVQTIETSALKLTSNGSVRGWEQVAKAFFRIDFQGTDKSAARNACLPFLYYVNQMPQDITDRLSNSGSLSLKMGSHLELEVHTVARPGTDAIRNPLGEVVLDLSHTATTFISSRRVRVDSSRDVKSIGISTSPTFCTTDGHISIRTVMFKKET